MSDKSHVSLEENVCPMCGNTHAVGVLLDRRLKNSLERTTVTGWSPCPECKQMIDDGYVALVGANPGKDTGTISLSDADRTGDLLWIRAEVFERAFNVPLPEQLMCFVEPAVVTWLKEKMAEAEAA